MVERHYYVYVEASQDHIGQILCYGHGCYYFESLEVIHDRAFIMARSISTGTTMEICHDLPHPGAALLVPLLTLPLFAPDPDQYHPHIHTNPEKEKERS